MPTKSHSRIKKHLQVTYHSTGFEIESQVFAARESLSETDLVRELCRIANKQIRGSTLAPPFSQEQDNVAAISSSMGGKRNKLLHDQK